MDGGGNVGGYSYNDFNAGQNGGKGGNGSESSGSPYMFAGAGVGNPGGNWRSGSYLEGIITYSNRIDGTGGLLIICTNSIINNGKINSEGVKASTISNFKACGGSSGGGSINIFYKNTYTNSGSYSIIGGATAVCTYPDTRKYRANGGAGGDGTVSIGRIVNGKYISD